MKRTNGFTVIELLFVVVLLATASVIFFVQKNNIEVAGRDEDRKTAINALYYSLEEVYYAKHGSYPRTLDEKTLPSVDPVLFTDPSGVLLGQTSVTIDDVEVPVESNYRYLPTNCTDNACKSYTLRTVLENEADYVKESRHN